MADKVKHYLEMARDCLRRADDGLDSSLWRYSLGQITKAAYYLSEAAFQADLLDLQKSEEPTKLKTE